MAPAPVWLTADSQMLIAYLGYNINERINSLIGPFPRIIP